MHEDQKFVPLFLPREKVRTNCTQTSTAKSLLVQRLEATQQRLLTLQSLAKNHVAAASSNPVEEVLNGEFIDLNLLKALHDQFPPSDHVTVPREIAEYAVRKRSEDRIAANSCHVETHSNVDARQCTVAPLPEVVPTVSVGPAEVEAPSFDRFLTLEQVIELAGFRKSFIYARKNFPQKIKIDNGKRSSVRWSEREVLNWIKELKASRKK